MNKVNYHQATLMELRKTNMFRYFMLLVLCQSWLMEVGRALPFPSASWFGKYADIRQQKMKAELISLSQAARLTGKARAIVAMTLQPAGRVGPNRPELRTLLLRYHIAVCRVLPL